MWHRSRSKKIAAYRTYIDSLRRSALKSISLAFILTAGAIAQVLPAIPDSNAVMAFESSDGWTVKGNAASATTVSSTVIRTQGRFALALANPADLTTLTSLPIASNATALAGVNNTGAEFDVDVLLPTQQGNPVNRGSLQLFVTCPSCQLNDALVGKVDFTPSRLGIFTTMRFPIPDRVRTALGGASSTGLSFQFLLSSPGTGQGTYIFDNLRVHSVALVMTDSSTHPPAGYGGSVDLVAIGGTPAEQQFDASPIQVPDGFHLKLGTAGSTTVQLDVGYDGTPSFTCVYTADTKDAGGKSYMLASCTGDIQAGDLVGASWVRLTIVGGDPSLKLRAQLARNPVGDQAGGGIIPVMPTFWGDFDGCVPTAVADGVVPPVASTPSASCAAQTAEANKIVTDYFNKVNHSQYPHNWIVTPVPEDARRHGDGSPQDLTGPPPPPNDPDFDEGGHINPGGNWDAYWRMNGHFMNSDPSKDADSTTDFDMTLSAHAVLFGQDLNVLSIKATEHSDSGRITPQGNTNPSANGALDAYVFGVNLYHADVQPCVAPLEIHADRGDDFTVEAQIWIFDVKLQANANAGIDATGTLCVSGVEVNVQPHATIGLHAFGGIGIAGLASGGVDVTIPRLLAANVNASALLDWSIYTNPDLCDVTLNFTVLVTADIESDGGDISLTATFGDCPFCWDVSHTIFSWGPLLASSPKILFQHNTSGELFPLPVSACKADLNVTINSPPSMASAGVPIPLRATVGALNTSTQINCTNATFTWSPSDLITGQGCKQFVTFKSAGPQTVSLNVSYTFPNSQITETGSAQEVVNVSALLPGSYIIQTDPAPSGNPPPQPPYNNQMLTIDVPNASKNMIQLVGEVIGFSGTTTTWSATDSTGTTTMISAGLTVTWTADIGDYTITMTTKDSGDRVVGTAMMHVLVFLIPR